MIETPKLIIIYLFLIIIIFVQGCWLLYFTIKFDELSNKFNKLSIEALELYVKSNESNGDNR